MARLTQTQRDRLKPSSFAGPNRSYPIPDKSHAANALSRVSQFGTPAEKSRVRGKVCSRYPMLESCRTMESER